MDIILLVILSIILGSNITLAVTNTKVKLTDKVSIGIIAVIVIVNVIKLI